MSKIKPWKLISKKDVSVGKWFPLEERTYQLPDGKVVDDFTVTTLPDVAMIIPFMKDGTIAMCRQYKPGAGEIILEFPAGRMEEHHRDLMETARAELKEETGIDSNKFEYLGETVTFPTKGSERINNYYVLDCEVNSSQELDENENIEVVFLTPAQIEEKMRTGEINTAPTMSAWLQLMLLFPELIK